MKPFTVTGDKISMKWTPRNTSCDPRPQFVPYIVLYTPTSYDCHDHPIAGVARSSVFLSEEWNVMH